MKITHMRVASLIFERPLMIEPGKLKVIINGVAPKIGADEWEDYGEDPVPKRERSGAVVEDGIAIIEVFNSLVKRTRGMEAESGLRSYEEIEYEILDAATNPAVTGILLQIDSGGGEANGAFDLSDLIFEVRKSIPVYAIADGSAFSAAYAIASAAEKLFVTQTGMVGSIGVIAVHCDQSGFDSKLGVKYTPIIFGARKNDFSPHEPLSDEATSVLQRSVDRLGEKFVATVARNRNLNAEDVRATQAGIMDPEDAIVAGFADEIGTVREAKAALTARISSGRRAPRPMPAPMQRAAEVPLVPAQTQVPSAPASAEANSTHQEDTNVSDTAKTPADATTSAPPTEQPAASVAAPATTAALHMSQQEILNLSELCQIAGKPHSLAGFISRNVTFADAKRELIAGRAEAAGEEIQSQVMPHVGTQTGNKTPGSLIDAVKRRIQMKGGRAH